MALNHYQNKTVPQGQLQSWDEGTKYRPSKGLINALNVALELSMPLILTGEPGTGKTKFAHHLAAHLDLGEVLVFNAKTTSTASDLFYRYQAVKHFQYIQSQANQAAQKSTEDFIEYQALGRAIKRAKEKGIRSVVLIDEVDKAPRDFPNDILNELEDLCFTVPELDQSFDAPEELRPIVILTSNSEKSLPEPFLRRCVYYNIDFPNPEELLEIIKLKIDENDFSPPTLETLIKEFEDIRKLAVQHSTKKPATAEFISWLAVLRQLEVNPETFNTPSADKEKLLQSYAVLAKSPDLSLALEKRVESWLKS